MISDGYKHLLISLVNMDEKQLLETFHDMGDIDAVQRIADCAFHFVENFENEKEKVICGCNAHDEHRHAYDANRYMDWRNEQL